MVSVSVVFPYLFDEPWIWEDKKQIFFTSRSVVLVTARFVTDAFKK